MTPTGRLRLDDQVCFALYAASNSVIRAYRPLLAELGLTYPQYLVMMVLWEGDDLPVQDLAARLELAPNGVTPVVRRLVETGLVTRHGDPHDGRVVRVRLTSDGAAMEGHAARAQAAVLDRTGLTPDAHAALLTALHSLTQAMATDADTGPSHPEQAA